MKSESLQSLNSLSHQKYINNHKDLSKDKLLDVSIEFEAILVKQMLDSMKKTLNKEKLIDGGMAEEIFDDFLNEKKALLIAQKGNFGLSKTIFHQLNQIQSLKSQV